MGRKFIQKWDSIFGAGRYYLSDSFNEMKVPQNKKLITQYGDSIYKSIRSANPEATWVMQGWTLSYQHGDWDEGIFEALVKNVPNDKFMALYMATEYKNELWNNYPKFYGKEWVWSVLPNMGGKTAMTGYIDNYANDRQRPWKSANRGNLTGYGFAPEGVENNEILYELITDGGWVSTATTINVGEWLKNYSLCRYGVYTDQQKAYHEGLRHSVYNSFRDHPQFGWQVSNNITGTGSVNQNDEYNKGVEALFADVAALRKNDTPLFQHALVEAAALYTSGKIERLNARIQSAIDQKQPVLADSLLSVLHRVMTNMDRALTCHPLYNLKVWEAQAQAAAQTPNTALRNARNARRIVSTWIKPHTAWEPVNDYSNRVWAGLVRDYYMPRLLKTWEQKMGKGTFDKIAFENAFVEAAPQLSAYEPVPTDTIQFLVDLVNEAKEAGEYKIEKITEIKASNNLENHWYAIRRGWVNNEQKVITQKGDNTPLDAANYMAAGTQIWRFIKSGDEEGVYRIENRWGQNIAGTGVQSSVPMAITSLANTDMRVKLTTDGTGRWTICPTAGGNQLQGLHYNSSMTTWTWKADDGGYAAASTWTIENVSEMMVPEVVSEDYMRYMKRLRSFDGTEMKGKLGQPKSAKALQDAKDSIDLWNANIAHESYDQHLAKWAKLMQKTVAYSTDALTNKLIDLLISARSERLNYEYSDTEVGFYPASSTSELDAVIEQTAAYLAMGATKRDQTLAHIDKLNAALMAFQKKMSGAGFNQPRPSTATEKHGYRMYTPHRDNRYVASQGAGREVMGVKEANGEQTIWDFYKRADNTYDIRNRANGTYLSPSAANNKALTTVSARPSAGWTLKKSNAEMLFVVTSGSGVMLNQTLEGLGWKVYNWGALSGQNGVNDAGCQYRFVYVGDSAPSAIAEVPQVAPRLEKIFDLNGRQLSEMPKSGIYIVNRKKVVL